MASLNFLVPAILCWFWVESLLGIQGPLALAMLIQVDTHDGESEGQPEAAKDHDLFVLPRKELKVQQAKPRSCRGIRKAGGDELWTRGCRPACHHQPCARPVVEVDSSELVSTRSRGGLGEDGIFRSLVVRVCVCV